MIDFNPKRPILIFGASGSLGSGLFNHLNILGLNIVQASRSDLINIPEYIKKINPGIIFNCLALTGLDKCATSRSEAIFANSTLVTEIISGAKFIDSPVIQFSTDSVFSCTDSVSLPTEITNPCPTTWYGASKYMGELNALTYKKTLLIRMPMLFGPSSHSQLISTLIQRAISGLEINASFDIYSTPAYIPDILNWIEGLLFGKLMTGDRIIHLSSDRIVSIYTCVSDILKILHPESNIRSVDSSFFTTIEKKPKYGGLASVKVPPFSYERSIKSYAQELLLKGDIYELK